ncbi:golgin subfamily A member 7 [Hemibagrus wyckioides]|uniref:golgin subfamily A member 7 n=1 Tax=Hemibagrus wyckioides TaxID=337641 RepID=UPI00266D3DF4|nr:golgin subfamily A member 7 [Hemibagrus wyckioides]XP_058268583.1 golgin subfamily A member 7 [Hemibagrus wyckioides]
MDVWIFLKKNLFVNGGTEVKLKLSPDRFVSGTAFRGGNGGKAAIMAETHSLQDLRQQATVASKVFVQRDYTSGTICRFQTKFPTELETRIDKQQFEETIQTLNNLYAEAEKLGGKSYLEGCLACLTAYTIFLCMETHYEKVLKKIAKYIQEQNEKIYAPLGLLLTDPIERGLRVVEITIFEDRSIGSR